MDYSPITFKDIYSPNNDNEIVYDESGHDTHYQNNDSRFGQTANPENLIPSYTGGINTQNIEKFSDNGEYYGSPNANEVLPRFQKGEYYNQQKENFDVNDPYWNGTVTKNNISTNVNERFTSNSNGDDCCVNCKRNTFLLYLIIALLVILYFKK